MCLMYCNNTHHIKIATAITIPMMGGHPVRLKFGKKHIFGATTNFLILWCYANGSSIYIYSPEQNYSEEVARNVCRRPDGARTQDSRRTLGNNSAPHSICLPCCRRFNLFPSFLALLLHTLFKPVALNVKKGFDFFCSFDQLISRVVVVFRFSLASRDTSHRFCPSLAGNICRRGLYYLFSLDWKSCDDVGSKCTGC